jgi:hypothetical protein
MVKKNISYIWAICYTEAHQRILSYNGSAIQSKSSVVMELLPLSSILIPLTISQLHD